MTHSMATTLTQTYSAARSLTAFARSSLTTAYLPQHKELTRDDTEVFNFDNVCESKEPNAAIVSHRQLAKDNKETIFDMSDAKEVFGIMFNIFEISASFVRWFSSRDGACAARSKPYIAPIVRHTPKPTSHACQSHAIGATE